MTDITAEKSFISGKRILLVHHTETHFEVLRSFAYGLAEHCDYDVVSSYMSWWKREEVVRLSGIKIYDGDCRFDAAVIITNHYPFDQFAQQCPEAFRLVETLPKVVVSHRFNGARVPGEIFLFSGADVCYIPTGLSPIARMIAPRSIDGTSRRLLVQGNIENRRDYGKAVEISKNFPSMEVNIVGQKLKDLVPNAPNINMYSNISELYFDNICEKNHFILPLIEPDGYPQYYEDRFTTSILRGFAAKLPFIAHKRLFEIYPIAGISYDNDEGVLPAIEKAKDISQEAYNALLSELEEKKASVDKSNLKNFCIALSEVL